MGQDANLLEPPERTLGVAKVSKDRLLFAIAVSHSVAPKTDRIMKMRKVIAKLRANCALGFLVQLAPGPLV